MNQHIHSYKTSQPNRNCLLSEGCIELLVKLFRHILLLGIHLFLVSMLATDYCYFAHVKNLLLLFGIEVV